MNLKDKALYKIGFLDGMSYIMEWESPSIKIPAILVVVQIGFFFFAPPVVGFIFSFLVCLFASFMIGRGYEKKQFLKKWGKGLETIKTTHPEHIDE